MKNKLPYFGGGDQRRQGLQHDEIVQLPVPQDDY
jgi:hypothetical protein